MLCARIDDKWCLFTSHLTKQKQSAVFHDQFSPAGGSR